MKKIYTIISAVFLSIVTMGSTSAQTVNFGGTTFDNDIVGWGDLYNLSFTSHNYGTARSMAMGNAFTALGADMVSATLNPAGIGMYVESDISFTPLVQLTKSPTEGGDPYYANGTPKHQQEFSDHTERFGMASAGAIFAIYRSTGALTNLNVGIVYNRIADFNQSTLNAKMGNAATASLANTFCTLANVDGLQTQKDGRMPFGNDPYYWGAVAAYKNGVINHDEQGWFIDRIAPDAIVDQYSSTSTRGSIGEYDISVGFNFIDRIYVGATIGIQNVYYRRNVYYGENYGYQDNQYPSGAEYPYQLEYMNYMQRTDISGSGVNFKVGVTGRPVDWLRIGVAYHSPTYYNLDLRYDLEMWSATYSAGNNPDGYDIMDNGYMYDNVMPDSPWLDSGTYAWHFRSPSRLLTGVAATIGKRVIISADYERSWYQSIRLQRSPIPTEHNNAVREVFKGSNTVRIGAEGYILPFLPVRVGYIWSGSTLRDGYKDMVATHPLPTAQSIITAGLGLKFNHTVYLDLAYQYSTTRYTDFMTFYAIDSIDPSLDIESALFSSKTMRHKLVLTLGFRF